MDTMSRRTALAAALLRDVVSHYLTSHDFNGIQLDILVGKRDPHALDTVAGLVRQGRLEIISGSWDNPHIRRLPTPETAIQLGTLQRDEARTICVYPTRKHMSSAIPRNSYRTKPFSRMLALGYPQLAPVFFDLSVLRRYQFDPRYIFTFRGLDGSIGIAEEHYRSKQMPDSDKVLLQSFGLGSTARRGHVTAVFLRYLSGMTARHQQYWNSHRIKYGCKVEANYYARSVYGEWTKGVSVYEALLQELLHINKMCGLIGLPPMFKDDFSDGRPEGFGLLIQTTFREYLNFADTLDKIISENLNPSFFECQGLSLRDNEAGTPKGTLRLLEEWLAKFIRFQDQDGPATILAVLKKVRKERSKLAHNLIRNDYSPSYQARKEILIKDVYISISNIRTFFETHPRTKGYIFPDEFDPQNIVFY
jgi:hypothetical protein